MFRGAKTTIGSKLYYTACTDDPGKDEDNRKSKRFYMHENIDNIFQLYTSRPTAQT